MRVRIRAVRKVEVSAVRAGEDPSSRRASPAGRCGAPRGWTASTSFACARRRLRQADRALPEFSSPGMPCVNTSTASATSKFLDARQLGANRSSACAIDALRHVPVKVSICHLGVPPVPGFQPHEQPSCVRDTCYPLTYFPTKPRTASSANRASAVDGSSSS